MTYYQYAWKEIKDKINTASDPNMLRLYEYSWHNYKISVCNVLVNLGYIEAIIVPYGYDAISIGYYKRLNIIPNDLYWLTAKELSKNKRKFNKGKKFFTGWALVVDKINKCETETFNRDDMSSTNSLDTYISVLFRLGYLEKLDRKGNFKILEKIPENLSSATANKYLYDNVYKRQRKIQKLKEKLTTNDNGTEER